MTYYGQAMVNAKEETIDYFVTEYWKMLEENLGDCINKFESYMKSCA